MMHQSPDNGPHHSSEQASESAGLNQPLSTGNHSATTSMVNAARIEAAFAPSIRGFDTTVLGSLAQLIDDSRIQYVYDVAVAQAGDGPASFVVESDATPEGMVTKCLSLEVANVNEKARALIEANVIERSASIGAGSGKRIGHQGHYRLTEEGKELVKEALVATNSAHLGNLGVYFGEGEQEAIQEKIDNGSIVIAEPRDIANLQVDAFSKDIAKTTRLGIQPDKESLQEYVTELFKEHLAFVGGLSKMVREGQPITSAADVVPLTEEELAAKEYSDVLRQRMKELSEDGTGEASSSLDQMMSVTQFGDLVERLSESQLQELGKQLIKRLANHRAYVNELASGGSVR